MPSSVYFGHNGKCAANFRTDEMDMNAPKELLNLDVLHRRTTSRNVETMNHGRFSTAPRGAQLGARYATHTTLSTHTADRRRASAQISSARWQLHAPTTQSPAGFSSIRTMSQTAICGLRIFSWGASKKAA